MRDHVSRPSQRSNWSYLLALGFAALLTTPKAYGQSAEELEKRFRIAMSCSAYAMIRTGEFPETVKVYREHQRPQNERERDRARVGMEWTNRSYFTANVFGAGVYQDLKRRLPTNGELASEKGKWVKILNDASEIEREAIRGNCKSIFEAADKFCSEKLCVEKL